MSAPKILWLLPFLVSAAVSAQSPTPDQAIYGPYPTNYREIVTDWLKTQTYDPSSIKLNWLGEPKPAQLPGEKGQMLKGYYVEFTVNARNRFGTYTGAQKHGALIRDGQVIKATGFGYH